MRIAKHLALALALIVAATLPLGAVEKAFRHDDLADAAIKLEAEIKREAEGVVRPVSQIKAEAETAQKRNDMRAALQLLGQVAALAPQDAVNWSRLARSVLGVRPTNASEQTLFLERASAAAYLAYQRATSGDEEAEALALIGRAMAERKVWRPALDALRLSLEKREVADIRGRYERLRDQHGFRLMDYQVDSDAVSPRVCFQFSEDLAKRVDLSPFVSLAGNDKPAVTGEGQQLCIDGLKHGERYSIALRAGIPSAVKEVLTKSADFNIYVRDRKPFARFTSRAYVLPRTGQAGIPVVTTNAQAVTIAVYRIGERNLINTVVDADFQRNLSAGEIETLGAERGAKIWEGELAVSSVLNEDVVTAFPVTDAVGELQPGVYVMVAKPKEGGKIDADSDYALATQWFIVSDLGVAAFSGNDGVHVFVHSLASAAPVGKVDVRLIARNNEVLAARKADEAGHVLFETGLTRGQGGMAPALVTVGADKGDYAFLSLKTSPFDLTDRGVAGRSAPGPFDAFLYAERGVYRSGETVHLGALLRDSLGKAVASTPLTLVVERPDGVEYRRMLVADQGGGGRVTDIGLNAAVPTGTWRVRAYVDPKGAAVGETTFMVEDYVPDRIEFDISSATATLAPDRPAAIAVDGRFLYGAPASDLALEGDIAVGPAKERPGFAGYRFGIVDEDEESGVQERQALEDLPQTDASGKATLSVALPKQPPATRLSQATIFLRMVEAGGRAVERTLTLPVTATSAMIGVKPLFGDTGVDEGAKAEFDVVFVGPDGKALALPGARYELLRLESRYQWFRQGSSWEYEALKSTRRVADGALAVSAEAPARLSLVPEPGRYRLELRGPDAATPLTSIQFDVGWYSDGAADTPDLLETALDKAEYKSGEAMTVTVNARSAGKLTTHVVGDRLLASQTIDAREGANQVRLLVGKDWGTGAYVVSTLRRPLDQVARRMPGRSLGLKWFSVDRSERTLGVALAPEPLARPGTVLKVPVRISGLASGEEAKITVAAVDVGILNLTQYKPPAPDEHYLGQRQLGAEIRDLYGQLIDGMQAARGQIRSGGDAPAQLQGAPPTQKPLALFSGIVSAGADGTAQVSFDLPEFAGTVRLMAVAWTATQVGHAATDVIVRDPVVLTTTLPRFLRAGDSGTLTLELDNVEGPAGDYDITVGAKGPVAITGSTTQRVKLGTKERSSLKMALGANAVGRAVIDVAAKGTGAGAPTLTRSYAIDVKPADQVLARRTVRKLAPGESVALSADMIGDFVPGTGSVSVSLTQAAALDAATVLRALDRYPFGCSEQVASRAMALLYVNEIAAETHLALDDNADKRIVEAIDRLLARQGTNGSFGAWSAGGEDGWLDAYVTDFLSRARDKKFAVPEVAFRQALDNLRNRAVNAEDPEKTGGQDQAYALYVLARNGMAPIGDLRYLADTKLGAIATPIAKAQLAAALALVGDRPRAERVFAAAAQTIPATPALQSGRMDYGSMLRDGAALVTLAAEAGAPLPVLATALDRVEAARGLSPFSSTQENAWIVLAARAIAKDNATIAVNVAGQPRKGAIYATYHAGDLVNPVSITNSGEAQIQVVVTARGAPTAPEPAVANGFAIERQFFTLTGAPADPSQAKQNDRFVVVLKITEPKPEFARVMVADYLPAGFEIDNPRLVSSGETGTLDWIADGAEPLASEFRDDRFNAAFDRKSGDNAVFTVAYVVRAVSPGSYVLPQAVVEDMYNPARYGRTATAKIAIKPAR